MYKLLKPEDLREDGRLWAIEHDLKNRMTSHTKNLKKDKEFLFPPGIKILKIRNNNTTNKIYNIVDNMYEGLNIPIKNGVMTYISGSCQCIPDDIIYDPKNEDFGEFLKKHNIKKDKKFHLFIRTPNFNKCSGIINVINSLNIKKAEKTILTNACIGLLKLYFEPKDYVNIRDILNKSTISLIKYIGNHTGHRLHLDTIKVDGPVFIINLGESWIDYVPFEEITKNEPGYDSCRFNIQKGDVFSMDGDSRRIYYHGVPPIDSDPNYLRYAMLIRIPTIYNRKKLCRLTYKYFQNNPVKWGGGKFECSSDTENIKYD